jgi:WD40 repeat protein
MKKSLLVGQLLLMTALAASVASAQSPRADIAWLAGGHISPIASVAYSPDGTMLASSGYFGDTLKLWRASDGSMVRSFGNTNAANQFIFGPMEPVTFLPDGRTVIALGEGAAIGSTRPALSWRG